HLDNEAYERGNSVYFPNRVLPMLPESLSNGMCSLNPDDDRLCMVCDMRISPSGEVTSSRFVEGLMRSTARLTYNQVAAYLNTKNANSLKKNSHAAPQLDNLYAVFQALLHARGKRGSLDLEIPEAYIEFDKQSRIKNISARHRNHAHRLIEECMLAANVAAAEYISKKPGGAVYRVHDAPGSEKLMELRQFLAGLGLRLGGGESPSAKDYAKTIAEVRKRPEIEGLVQTVLLRSLSQAMYSVEKGEHFALNYPMYTHFTSPIRRYPDLVVHRTIKSLIHKQSKAKRTEKHISIPEMADHCSFTERRADDATRDAVQWLKAEYMLDKIGETFDGTVSGVTAFGLFVQLDSVFVEGLIHVTALGDDYYDFDPLKYRLMGQRSGRVFRLGEKLSIRVMAVNLDAAKIDFELNKAEFFPKKRAKKSKKRIAKKRTTKKATKTSSRRHKTRKR
ncbi:MAG: VacB/RNase II family 3'-5' exoribonuclease, partial [Gammaproteobacteria bacterium]|nr:VacB/RNase II family 3'-5' exoribonuclease [Gammaproteobacteria bacterium]